MILKGRIGVLPEAWQQVYGQDAGGFPGSDFNVLDLQPDAVSQPQAAPAAILSLPASSPQNNATSSSSINLKPLPLGLLALGILGFFAVMSSKSKSSSIKKSADVHGERIRLDYERDRY